MGHALLLVKHSSLLKRCPYYFWSFRTISSTLSCSRAPFIENSSDSKIEPTKRKKYGSKKSNSELYMHKRGHVARPEKKIKSCRKILDEPPIDEAQKSKASKPRIRTLAVTKTVIKIVNLPSRTPPLVRKVDSTNPDPWVLRVASTSRTPPLVRKVDSTNPDPWVLRVASTSRTPPLVRKVDPTKRTPLLVRKVDTTNPNPWVLRVASKSRTPTPPVQKVVSTYPSVLVSRYGDLFSNTTLLQNSSRLGRDLVSFRPSISQGSRNFSSTILNASESYQSQQLGAELPPYGSQDQETLNVTNLDIRDRLRLWTPSGPVNDLYFPGPDNLSNRKIYDQLKPSEDCAVLDSEPMDYHSSMAIYGKGVLVDVGNSRTFLLRGDLVELRSQGGLHIELGIFIRTVGMQSQFYTMSGKWIHQKSFLPKFYVPGFVKPHELDPLLPYLPDKDVSEALQGTPQSFEHAPPRNVGASILNKILEFWKNSDAIYRSAAFKIDNAHQLTANLSTLRYANLAKLADTLLPTTLKKDGHYPAPALYALHRSLCRDASCFRPEKLATHRTWGRFEISSVNEVYAINAVCEDVRCYQESLMTSAKSVDTSSPSNPLSSSTNFTEFITKAQGFIDESRKTRTMTPYGTIGPVEPGMRNAGLPKTNMKARFEESDNRYLSFMESWCCLKTFDKHSILHGVASTILRATGRYEGLDLEEDTGWMFLQEIGVIAPWENPVVFDIRLPTIGRILSSEKLHEDWDQLPVYCLRPDVLRDLRKDWGQLPVYCIDSSHAKEIDDGISIEPTISPGEYWVHIHTADPASRISPQGQIANRALSVIQSTYLPERLISMLPHRIVQENLSLEPHQNCLTFSARVNQNGDILEYKITPSIINNVLFLTPELIYQVLGETSPEEKVITVGIDQENEAASTLQTRPILQRCEVTAEHEKNLRLLHSISTARSVKATSKGAIDFCDSNFLVSIPSKFRLFNRKTDTSRSIQYNVDPVIQLTAGKWDPDNAAVPTNPVKELMLLGGEVAARWCHERGIPIIYRVTQSNPEHPDPTSFFCEKILPYVARSPGPGNISSEGDRTAYPSREALKAIETDALSQPSIPIELKHEYLRQLGMILPSTTAGPHVALGLEMFTRVTSPLRRCGDLIVHWQIEAALLEEARTGKSLIGSTSDDYLPFKKSDIDEILPYLDSRERLAKSAGEASQQVWAIQLLLRAWKFNQALLPPTFKFVVRDVSLLAGMATGQLVYFGGLRACMNIPKWIQPKDVKPRDIFEVELEELNVYSRRIGVAGLRRIKST